MKMIKQILMMTLVLFLVQSASAQVKLGLMGGANFSNFRVGVDQPIPVPLPNNASAQGSFSSRTSFAIGGVAEYSLSPMIALSVQPMYSRQGSKFKFDGPVVNPLSPESTVKLNYIDIPVMLKVQFGGSSAKPYVTSGFTLGFLTSAKSGSADFKDDLKSTNISWNIGGGLSMPAGGRTFFIEGRYMLGLSDIYDASLQAVPLSAVSELKTKGFQVMAGVTFPMGS